MHGQEGLPDQIGGLPESRVCNGRGCGQNESMACTVAFVPGAIGVAALAAYVFVGGVLAALALYQLLLAFAAFFHRDEPGGPSAPRLRLAVLVPAHDEGRQIARCVGSLRAQGYPEELVRIVVVADNCTDDTAARAAEAGADVLVRLDPAHRGKGRALRWALEQVLARDPAPDAVVVVDADSEAQPGFLAGLARTLEQGAEAVQGESLLVPSDAAHARVRAAAFLLVNRVRPAGRAVLGGPCSLAGNGMAFRRDVLQAHPWGAFTSTEDLEYSLVLRLNGIRPVFAAGAVLLSPTAPSTAAAAQQQLRWEGGKLHLARTWTPRLLAAALRQRRPGLLDAAVELAIPPLAVLAGLCFAGAVAGAALAAARLVPPWTAALWVVAAVAVALYVVVGLRAARAPAWAYRSLAQAPLVVARKVAAAPSLARFRGETWVRTERHTEEHPLA